MQLKKLLKEDDAVSPVIGVILMVAITVILAAVIATFVLGLGDQVSDTSPQASFSFSYEEGTTDEDFAPDPDIDGPDGVLKITHNGGATIDASRLTLSGSTGYDNGGSLGWGDADGYDEGSSISAGDRVQLAVNSDDTVNVVWTSQDGGQSDTLQTWNGPDS